MPIAHQLKLSIPAGSALLSRLFAQLRRRQAQEADLAKTEAREPREITLQEVVLELCAAQLGVTEFERPKRGRRWPAKDEV